MKHPASTSKLPVPPAKERFVSAAAIRRLTQDWQDACDTYLPVKLPASPWRFSRTTVEEDPTWGWKLHVSSTILTATSILAAVGPLLRRQHVLFKAPESLTEIRRLNCGLFYGYCQVGKCITIYPKSTGEARRLATELDRLTCSFKAPRVPFEPSVTPKSIVFYRYGQMRAGEDADSVVNPPTDNRLVAVPSGIVDCIGHAEQGSSSTSIADHQKLRTRYRVFEALTQRGKGGLYRALDLGVQPARLCIIKEGRRHGETDWDGCDGYSRVGHEAGVLFHLTRLGMPVPAFYDLFEQGDSRYLVMEHIEGNNLNSVSLQHSDGSNTQLGSLRDTLTYSQQIAAFVAQLHSNGYVWRDCKPANILIGTDGRLRFLDFERACKTGQTSTAPWGTAQYVSPEWLMNYERTPQDLFALGKTLYQLLTGSLPGEGREDWVTDGQRHIVSDEVRNLVSSLMDFDPVERPSAAAVAKYLAAATGRCELSERACA